MSDPKEKPETEERRKLPEGIGLDDKGRLVVIKEGEDDDDKKEKH